MKAKVKSVSKRNLRYLLIENADKSKIEKAILEGIGAIGWAKAEPVFVEDKTGAIGQRVVLAVNREMLDGIRASFEIFNEKVDIKRVSGTLKGLLNT